VDRGEYKFSEQLDGIENLLPKTKSLSLQGMCERLFVFIIGQVSVASLLDAKPVWKLIVCLGFP